MFICLFQIMPFEGYDVAEEICEGLPIICSGISHEPSEDAADLLKRMSKVDPAARNSADAVIFGIALRCQWGKEISPNYKFEVHLHKVQSSLHCLLYQCLWANKPNPTISNGHSWELAGSHHSCKLFLMHYARHTVKLYWKIHQLSQKKHRISKIGSIKASLRQHQYAQP